MKEKEEAFLTEKVSEILEKFRDQENGLIPILLEIQKEFGYLPKESLKRVASFLGVKPIEVWGWPPFLISFG